MTEKQIEEILKKWGVGSEIQRQMMAAAVLCYADPKDHEGKEKACDIMEAVGEKFNMTQDQVYNRLRVGISRAAKSKAPEAKQVFGLRERYGLGIFTFIKRFYEMYIYPEILEEGLRAVLRKTRGLR